jgi:hypothetical protein
MRISSGLAGLLELAKDGGRQNEVPALMEQIAKRIHANQQSEYLSTIRHVWRPYLLAGWLREKLSISLQELQDYAKFILDTTKARLENGAIRPDDVYADFSIQQLLTELDHNTVSDPEYSLQDNYDNVSEAEESAVDPGAGENDSESQKLSRPSSILKSPATTEQIVEAETRLSRKLPEDLKDLLLITNGCRPVKIMSSPTFFKLRIPALDDIFLEEEDYMLDYMFELLPDANLGIGIDWPGIEGGGIALYEHDGQGTEYVWILTESLVEEAKSSLQMAYDEADEEKKGAIDRQIVSYYGSREVYDELKTCLYLQCWGEPNGQIVFPTFKSYLNWVAYQSRGRQERSPLKGVDGEED